MRYHAGWEPHRERHALRDFGESRLVRPVLEGRHLVRHLTREVARAVDAVDADVLKRTTAERLRQPDVRRLGVLAVRGANDLERAELLLATHLDRAEVRRLVLQTISDHQRALV